MLTDKSGSDVGQFLYTPFGEMWVEEASSVDISHITRFFTNQQYDKESGLYYYNARYYDPHLGSFITPDPAMDGLNHYAYANSNPIKYTDPTGLYGDYSDPSGPPTQYEDDEDDDYDDDDDDDYDDDDSGGSGGSDDYWKNLNQKVEDFNKWVKENCSNHWEDAIRNGYEGPFNYRGDRSLTRDQIIDKMGYDIPKSNDTKGVRISIGYTRISNLAGFFAKLLGQYHTFAIVTNPRNGDQYITRAGPGGEGGVWPFNSILAWAGVWNNSSPYDKPSETVRVQYIGTVNITFNEVVNRMIEYSNLINSNEIQYKLFSQNSNSYTFTFVESLGFRRPTPVLSDPGWRTNLLNLIK